MAAFGGDDRDIEMGIIDAPGSSHSAREVRVIIEPNELTGESWNTPNLEIKEEECTGSESLPYMNYSEGNELSTASGRDSTSAAVRNDSTSARTEPSPSLTHSVALDLGDDRDIELGLPSVAGPSGSVGVRVLEQNELAGESWSAPNPEEEGTSSESLPYMSNSEGDDSLAASRKNSTSTRNEQSPLPTTSVAMAFGGYRDIELGLPGVAGPSGFAGAACIMQRNELAGEGSSTSTNTEVDERTRSESVPSASYSDSDDSLTAARKAYALRRNQQTRPPSPTLSEVLDMISRAVDNAAPIILSSEATIKAANDAVIIGTKREQIALLLSEIDDGNRNSLFYRTVAARYRNAVSSVRQRCLTLGAMTSTAEAAVTDAKCRARKLAGLPSENYNSATSEDGTQSAYWAANTINSAILETRKNEYKTLKAMRSCWVEIEYYAGGNVIIDPRNVTIYGSNCDPKNRRLRHVAHAILFILGCSLIGISMLFRESTGSFTALLIVGVFLVTWPVISLVHEIRTRYLKARDEERRNNAREVVAALDSKLKELRTYFQNNGIRVVETEN